MEKAIAFIAICIAIFQGIFAHPFDADSSIVNGQRASPGEFPYQISLHENSQHNCGGFVLNENYVLTAAHCVSRRSPSILKVIAGTVDLNKIDGAASTHTVTNIKIHEQYNEGDSWKNDIALLKVNPPFKFSSHLGPAQLPTTREAMNDGSSAVVSGFGMITLNSFTSRQLLKTNVFIESHDKCQQKYMLNRLYNTNICTVSTSATGFCNGDSGGPLTVDGKVVGIVSFALNNGCASGAKESQVYTRVSEYLSWIHYNTNNENNDNNNDDKNKNNDIDKNEKNNEDNNNEKNDWKKNPTQEFNEWIKNQNPNSKDWINDLNKKYQEWLESFH